MHYYKHDINAFNAATRHLTRLERGVYLDLIHRYYDTEKPFNLNELDRLEKQILCVTEEEKKAMRYILNEFFELKDGFYHNERCDKEIQSYHALVNGAKKGGRNSAKARSSLGSSHVEGDLSSGSTNYELRIKNQELINNTPIPPQGAPAKKKSEFKKQAEEILIFLNERCQKDFKPVPANLDPIVCRLKEGATLQDCKSIIAMKRRKWLTDEKMKDFLRPGTIFRKSKFWNYQGELLKVEDENHEVNQ